MKNVAAWLALTDEDRAKALEAKRLRAQARMKVHGIHPIDKREWVGSAHEAPSLQKRATLTPIRRKA